MVKRVRNYLNNISFAKLIYEKLKVHVAEKLPEFRPEQQIEGLSLVFVSASGKTYPRVAPLYSHAGFYKVFQVEGLQLINCVRV